MSTTSVSGAPRTSSSDAGPTAPVNTFRSCSFCKALKVPIAVKFKLCSDCREKSRNTARKYRESRKVLGAVSISKKQANKPSKLGAASNFSSVPDVKCTEYQTSSELFGAMKSLSTSTFQLNNRSGKLLQFHGSYTIVAASDIDNLQRVWLLATELSAKAWLPFRSEPPLSSIGDESIQTLRFACTCHGTAASISSHRNDENVSATSTFILPGLCGGVLTLKSIVDKSHPLGIPGQQIVVRVEHPLSLGHPPPLR